MMWASVRIPSDSEAWVKAAAAAAAILGATLRCVQAATVGLNPDEALQLVACHQDRFADAVRTMATFHHPPMYLALTYLARPLLYSEFGARLIPVVAGSLLPVILFLWLRPRLGLVGASTALFATALSHNLITLSAQVRSYSLAILLAAVTLLLLDQGIERLRPSRILLAGISLGLAITTDYSLAFVTPAITLYGFARLKESRAPRACWIAWTGGALAALVIFGALYWFHVRSLPTTAQDFSRSWLKGGFPVAGGSLLVFLAGASLKQFAYLAGSVAGGVVWLAAFAAALAAASRPWRLLLVMPFATGLTLSLLRLLPFGRTRHSAIVSICVAAGLALAAHRWLESRPRFWLGRLPLVMALMGVVAGGDLLDIPAGQLDRQALRSAPAYLDSVAGHGPPILATREARRLVVCYGLMERRPPLPMESIAGESLKPAELEQTFAQFRRRHGLAAGDPVYFLEGGFSSVEWPPPRPEGPLRRFGVLRLWRVGGAFSH